MYDFNDKTLYKKPHDVRDADPDGTKQETVRCLCQIGPRTDCLRRLLSVATTMLNKVDLDRMIADADRFAGDCGVPLRTTDYSDDRWNLRLKTMPARVQQHETHPLAEPSQA